MEVIVFLLKKNSLNPKVIKAREHRAQLKIKSIIPILHFFFISYIKLYN